MASTAQMKLSMLKDTARQVGKNVGISRQQVYFYKTGYNRPANKDVIKKFKKIYGINPVDWHDNLGNLDLGVKQYEKKEESKIEKKHKNLKDIAMENKENRKNETQKRSIPYFLDQFTILEGCQCPVCHFYIHDPDRYVCKYMIRDITGIDCRNEKVVFIKKEIWAECNHSNTQPGCVVRHKTSHLKSNVVHVMPQDTGEYKYDVIVKRVDNGAIQKWNMMNLEVLEELNI